METIIVVAPHPDDETYGCGGTLLRHRACGNVLHWLVVTGMSKELGYSADRVSQRKQEIDEVSKIYGFNSVRQLDFPPAGIDNISLQAIVSAIGQIFLTIKPSYVYVPYSDDAHSDHRIVFDAVVACSKWFRFNSIKKLLAYETLSETDFNLNPNCAAFKPNYYVNIAPYLEEKISIAKKYLSEIGDFPFPRSEKSIRVLANFRGSLSGYTAAEAFMLLKALYD